MSRAIPETAAQPKYCADNMRFIRMAAACGPLPPDSMRVAVLNSDPDQAKLIREVLAAQDHTCYFSTSGKDFLDRMQRESVDMLVLDWPLPDDFALDIIRNVSGSTTNLPVLLTAARTSEAGIAEALATGTSDYQVKPLRRGELALRVKVLLSRAYPERQAAEIIRFGRYAFATGSGQLTVEGVPTDVTQKEFALALLFFRHLGRPLSRAYIQENVWSREADIPSRTMDTHVSRVRNKLGLRPENGFRLAPVYSYGYQLEELAK